jgi:hypothetical protein
MCITIFLIIKIVYEISMNNIKNQLEQYEKKNRPRGSAFLLSSLIFINIIVE